MPTLSEYADRVASNDTGLWRAAVDRVAEFFAVSGRYWPAGSGTYPGHQVPFRAAAVLLFALAADRRVTPADVELAEVRAWLDELPPEAWIDTLAAMLTRAGYTLPPRRLRPDGNRPWVGPSGDPAVDTWTEMTYLPDPDAVSWDGSDSPWPDPVLPSGLMAWRTR